nr:16S rRNA (guanine(527)-N(7))-methyltransferase RsmG [Halorhodospira abdelmalekii]
MVGCDYRKKRVLVTEQQIEEAAQRLGIALTGSELTHLAGYVNLLSHWNRAYNLTAAKTSTAIIERHVVDSLTVRAYLPAGQLLDVGSGAGLPGIPLAIVEPQRSVTLVDSNGKKARFLRQCKLSLGLVNVAVMQTRMEQLAPACCDIVTARAVAPLGQLLTLLVPLLRPGGSLLALKGARAVAEVAALPEEWRRAVAVHDLPSLEEEGCAKLVIYRRSAEE